MYGHYQCMSCGCVFAFDSGDKVSFDLNLSRDPFDQRLYADCSHCKERRQFKVAPGQRFVRWAQDEIQSR